MPGETIRCEAICLFVRPWSRTSHIVNWLTPSGVVGTVVKGAVRPKSAFLGQYDLNYTCEILYYARASGGLHALRECAPVKLREELRDNWRLLALADYFRRVCEDLAPTGPECAKWQRLLAETLDALTADAKAGAGAATALERMLAFEQAALELSGLTPDFSGWNPDAEYSEFGIEAGAYGGGGRRVHVAAATAAHLAGTRRNADAAVLLDALRVIGVFWTFHLECATDARRALLRLVAQFC